MDTAMEEIIKNIIHIDKSAAELKDNFDKQIEERKRKVSEEIDKLRAEIVDSQIQKSKEFEKREIEMALSEAEHIKLDALKRCSNIQERFKAQKNRLVHEIFNEIFKNQAF